MVAARCAPVETESRDASQIKPESASTVTEGRSAAASALARRSLLLAAAGAVVAPPPLLPSQLLRGGAAPAAQAKVNVTKVEKAQSEGERDVSQAASGFRFSDAKVGRGEQPRYASVAVVYMIY